MIPRLLFLLACFSFFISSGCSISGNIEDNGVPLEGVSLTVSGPISMTAVTDSSGKYLINGMPPGTYTITPTLDEYAFYPEIITVTLEKENKTGIHFYTEDSGAGLRIKPYNAVAYVTTHNAMSNEQDFWFFPNQTYNIGQQLRDGVHAFMLDIWPKSGDVYLCHGGIFVGGSTLLENELNEIKIFMDMYTREIITIIFESYVTAEDVRAVFESTGLIDYMHVQPADQPWPTLQEMIDQNRRLIVFTDTDDALPDMPWYHYGWDYYWETHYSAATPEDFSCAPNRGDTDNSLFILNHFLTNEIGGAKYLAEQVNYTPFFGDRGLECQGNAGQLPNFITVDFYSVGDAFEVVDMLNNQ